MDQLDLNLFDAWHQISARCRADRVEALQRSRRRFNDGYTRPPRAWCLCVRASDTRISPYNAIIELHPDTVLGLDESVEHVLRRGEPHTVTLEGDTIRQLTKPVILDWPGVEWTIAARRLGRHCETLRSWIKRGALQVFEHRTAQSLGKRGKPIPIVWAPSPLDPNATEGQAPDRIWGTLWQYLWEKLPENYSIAVQREPAFGAYDLKKWDEGECYDLRQRGWRWICPGRYFDPSLAQSAPQNARLTELDGEPMLHVPCGRRVRALFGPQTVWTLARALGDDRGFEMPADSGLAGRWHPGMSDPIQQTGPRSFACRRCWRVQYSSLIDRAGWNKFIMHLSGGLLYGHEVERPHDEAPKRRKRRYVPRPRPAPRREQVKRLLVQGLMYKQIAQRMGVSYGTVHAHVKKIYREHGVHSRAELIAKIKSGREWHMGRQEPLRTRVPR